MTNVEMLAVIKQMTTQERLETIEAISRMMREELQQQAQRKAEMEQKLKAAAVAAIPDYMPGGALHDLWSVECEPYYDSEEEYLSALNAEEKTNA